MAPQTIIDCGNFTLDLKQLGLSVSPLFLQTLGPRFPRSSVKYPQSMMVSGAMSSAGVSFTVRLPALGLSVFQLYMSFDTHTTLKSNVRVYLHGRDLNMKKQDTFSVKLLETSTDDFYVENQYIQVWFSGVTGLMKGIKRAGEEQEQKVSMEFLIYGTRTSKDKSGAYLFLPDGDAKLYTPKDPPVVRVIEGPFISEVTCHFQHVQQTMRVYNLPGTDGLSVDMSSLIDIRDHVNKEIAMRISTDIQSEDTFFTDLNGFQILREFIAMRSHGELTVTNMSECERNNT
ncbi:unnamed protein product [Ranitomeya imitator]|uniref:Glycosyl hydrolase family 38 C-terminal domain-containing protein n=1 Tax=Ranitomeya imitator TaxID=111125 RepID=A0ABN9LK72_9NEOB|nr:unnamed protein product [Ranitomeya imitator]